MLHIVTINNSDRYLVDVGFGGNTPPIPVPLPHLSSSTSSKTAVEFTTIHPAKGKLEYRPLVNNPTTTTTTTTTSSPYADRQNLWIYSHKETEKDGDAEWKEMYAFSELEFFPADFEVMNLQVMTAPQSFFVQTVLCVRTVLSCEDLSSSFPSSSSSSGGMSSAKELSSKKEKDGEKEKEKYDEEKIIGTLILFRDVVKRKIYCNEKGEMEEQILERLETEEQRWAALGRWFGIYLTEEEKRGIRGLASELKG